MNKTANNLFLVLTLKTLFLGANIIAISNSFENARKLKYAGATNVIDLYEATSRRFVNILTKPAVTKAVDEIIYKENDLKMAEIVLPKESRLDKTMLSEFDFRSHGIVLTTGEVFSAYIHHQITGLYTVLIYIIEKHQNIFWPSGLMLILLLLAMYPIWIFLQ